MTTTTRTYWESQNGEVSCERHAGAYVAAAIEATPNAQRIETPLGVYYKMSAADVNDFESFLKDEMGVAAECCETCRRAA